MPNILPEPPPPYVPYVLTVAGADYTILEPSQPDAHRVRTQSGQVIGLACADSADTLNAAGLAALLAAPQTVAAGVVILTPLTILGRLTPTEEAALATSTDLAVAVVRNRLIAASEVRSDDPRTTEGKAILVAKGIVTAERAVEIFA